MLATCAIAKCIHPKKDIHDHLSEIHGEKIWIETTEEEKKSRQGLKENNDADKENFACFSEALQSGGCIRNYHSAGEGQYRYNNDYGRMYTEFVSGRKINKTTPSSTVELFHELTTEFQDTLVFTRKRQSDGERKGFETACREKALMKATNTKKSATRNWRL